MSTRLARREREETHCTEESEIRWKGLTFRSTQNTPVSWWAAQLQIQFQIKFTADLNRVVSNMQRNTIWLKFGKKRKESRNETNWNKTEKNDFLPWKNRTSAKTKARLQYRKC